MARKNPFSKAVADTAASKTTGVEQAGAELRKRASDEELQQATNDGGDGSDVPSAVSDNADAEKKIGDELGLGTFEFESAKDRVGDEAVDLGASDDVDTSTFQTAEERIAARGTVPQFNIDGMSTQDALAAASGADNTDVGDLENFDPRSLADAARAERNPLNDPQIAATMAFVEEASDTSVDKLSVAAEPGETTATAGMAAAAAGMATAAVGATVGAGAVVLTGTGIVAVGTAVVAGSVATAADNATGGEFGTAFVNSIPGGRLVAGAANAVGEAVVAVSDVAAGAATPSEAAKSFVNATSGSSSTGAAGSGKGGGTKLTNPDDDRSPPTEAEIAFRKATNDALGIRHIPGDIDPGDGDGTQGGAPVSEDEAEAIAGVKSKNSLVGNPGSPEAGAVAKAPTTTGGARPGLGGHHQGGDVDFEDGSGFTGGVRTTGPQDVDFGVGSKPLIGLGKGDEEEEEDDDSDDADDDEDEG